MLRSRIRNPSHQLPCLEPPFCAQLLLRRLIPLPHHSRRIRAPPLQSRDHSPEARRVFASKLAHVPVISRDARTFGSVQDRRGAALGHDVVFCEFEIGTLLFPEEEDVEAGHERGELVGDVLEDFGVLFEGAEEGGVCFEGFGGDGGGGEFLETAEEVRLAGAVVRGAEEDDAVGAGVDGVDVGDFGGGTGCRVSEGSFHDDAAE